MTDPYEFPELFDLEFGDVTADLGFYESFARRCEGAVLELGVGTGRVAIPLGRRGIPVYGIDVSDAMLKRAGCNAGPDDAVRARLMPGDMRSFSIDQEFGLIFAALGTFHHLLTRDDQLACLERVRTHLAPGGLFICDMRPFWHEEWAAGDSAPLLHDWTRVLPGTGETVLKLRSARPDRHLEIVHETHVYEILSADGTTRRVVADVDWRFSTRYEMEGLLSESGLKLDQMYGDFDLAPFDEMSDYMITAARRP